MSELWIRNPGAADEYGPLTLTRLRELIEAGLVLEDSLVNDGKSSGRRITDWPELMEALIDPAATTWAGAVARPGLKRGVREVPLAGVPSEPVFESEPVLQVGARGEFARAEPVDAPASPSVLEVLARNRHHELPFVPEDIPWYRYPVARNAGRWLTFVLPLSLGYGALLAADAVRFGKGMQVEDAAVATLFYGFVFLWSWQVWVLEPVRWRLIVPKDSVYRMGGVQ